MVASTIFFGKYLHSLRIALDEPILDQQGS